MKKVFIYCCCVFVYLQGSSKTHEELDKQNYCYAININCPWDTTVLNVGSEGKLPFCLDKKFQVFNSFSALPENIWMIHISGQSRIGDLIEHKNILRDAHVVALSCESSRYPSLNYLRRILSSYEFFPIYQKIYFDNQYHDLFLKKDLYRSNYMRNELNDSTRNFLQSGKIMNHLKPVIRNGKNHSYGMIDFVYLINLDHRPEKFRESIKMLTPYKINPLRFSAVNGWQLTKSDLDEIGVQYFKGMPSSYFASYFIQGKEQLIQTFGKMDKEGTGYYISGVRLGTIGCLLSHLSIMKDMVDNDYAMIMVLEDDIEVKEDPFILFDLIKELDFLCPDWDILFPYPNYRLNSKEEIKCQSVSMRPNSPVMDLSYYMKKNKIISKNLSFVGCKFGTQAMIIKRSGALKILDFYKKYHMFGPIDIDMYYIPGLTVVCTNRHIITNALNSLSDNAKFMKSAQK